MTFPLEKSQYKILNQVGKGVTAVVYVAECLANGRTVALKTIDLETCPIEIENLRHEVAFWSTSQSPNVVKYHGSFVEGSVLYIVMEYMSAGSCYEIMRYSNKKGIQDEAIIAAILHEVLQALCYFHDNRQIHRDIKAGNILINEHGDVKIGDFGISANLLEGGQRKRARFTVIGTPCYMAPEVLKEEEGYTEKADIWSLGITAIELAIGAAPYANLFPLEVIVKIVNSPPPQLPEDAKFSSAFRDFIKSCLVQSPAKRPTAHQLLEHKFFKQAKDIKGLTKKLVESLPPLATRFQAIHNSQQEQQSPKPQEIFTWEFPTEDPQTPVEVPSPVPKKVTPAAAPAPQPSAAAPAAQPQAQPAQQPQGGEGAKTVSRVGKFTITKTENTAAPKEQQAQAAAQPEKKTVAKTSSQEISKDDEDKIAAMQAEIKDLKAKVEFLKNQNVSLKNQLDALTNDVKQLMK
ncbi:STE family protein kinase [Trichomonas vaginalis G3]|uniref:STE family protein kinase n=1 Tax=Trichomonas vaginalis (strain ATCC PRA-98 / G3) TaxID=412133 RepID=A2FCS6_TRIV3|nr:STKc OSR1 SPAK domain-containing protein [Trichomonas vaginalis G3]EAX97300.1 STE family protein kinase [Trichomonas vaginalis G3]KAI5518172.1 STKc OSR1 SPAK domain-containing protein [Trichomonas vaginalis G3]|eukprot:XP_001310230.1 STE family protein kinase [Trichomonas vaginalis G3]